MKKRWGKPITQVQRFVPQEYCVVCNEYKLKSTGFSSKIYIDYQNPDIIDSDENDWGTTYNGQTVSSSGNYPVIEIQTSESVWYQLHDNWGEPRDKKYSAAYNGERYFTTLSPKTINIYKYRNYLYTGEKLNS